MNDNGVGISKQSKGCQAYSPFGYFISLIPALIGEFAKFRKLQKRWAQKNR
jgi:hypothetical protein